MGRAEQETDRERQSLGGARLHERSDKFSTLRSALAVPLVGLEGVVGVLALYNADKDAFTADHFGCCWRSARRWRWR